MKILTATLTALLLTLPAIGAGRAWSLTDIHGNSYGSVQASGRPTLLIFWATWCKPCKSELTALKSTYDDLAARGLNVLLISEDTQKSKSRVKPYIVSKGLAWTALHDPDGEVLKLYGGTSIPFSVLLDDAGSPVYEHRGEMKDPATLIARADALLRSERE